MNGLAPRARPKAVLEVGAGGGRRLPSGCTGVSPLEMFGNFMCKMGHFGASRSFGKVAKCVSVVLKHIRGTEAVRYGVAVSYHNLKQDRY